MRSWIPHANVTNNRSALDPTLTLPVGNNSKPAWPTAHATMVRIIPGYLSGNCAGMIVTSQTLTKTYENAHPIRHCRTYARCARVHGRRTKASDSRRRTARYSRSAIRATSPSNSHATTTPGNAPRLHADPASTPTIADAIASPIFSSTCSRIRDPRGHIR
jgi:hypothetical protein